MGKIKLFISYSHKDDSSRQELNKWLVTLKDKGLAEAWFDGYIIPGDRLLSKITTKMGEADVILLLLSQDYLASDSCKEEMKYALIDSQKKVIPIILKDCAWSETGCKELLVLPKDGKPISKWEDKEESWHNVYEGIRNAIYDLQQRFEIKKEFSEELQQIEFVTQNKKRITLDDIFVFPNVYIEKEAFKKEVIGFDFFLEEKKKFILLRGREFSGKTALLRWLFMKLREKCTTILLDGNDIQKTLNFDTHFKKEFSKQMQGDFDIWMSQTNKVAIIDNFNHSISGNILDYLDKNFVMVILATDDEEYMLYYKDDPNIVEYSTTTLGQFDFVQQEELIRKWFQLSRQCSSEEVHDLDIDKLEDRVNDVITNQRIVPRYPFYILGILQSLETFLPSDIHITAYGHCYQALVTAQLVKKNIRYEDLDTCFNYLRYLSFHIYNRTKDGHKYSKKDYLDFQVEYKSKFIISDMLIHKIENDDYPILDYQEETIQFKYSYIYFYFLGMYIAYIGDEKIIEILCKNVHLRQNAFILIFTVHHTQNRVLLDTIRLHCIYSFEKIQPAKLSVAETEFMNNLIAELPESIISNNSTIKNRIDQRKRKESSLVKESETKTQDKLTKSSNKDEEVSQMELIRGMRIMEVLGQILKNRAGSFERKDVADILSETINLGLRILKLLVDEAQRPEFEEWLLESLEDAEKELEETQNKKFDKEKQRAFIKRTIQFFGYVVTTGMLNRISESITSDKLTETMFILSQNNSTPAYELICYLVSTSQTGADIEYIKELLAKYHKSKNHWAERALSYYVQNFLNTHNLNFKDRQRLFSALNLKYIPNKS